MRKIVFWHHCYLALRSKAKVRVKVKGRGQGHRSMSKVKVKLQSKEQYKSLPDPDVCLCVCNQWGIWGILRGCGLSAFNYSISLTGEYLGMGRYQYRYRKYRHIGKFFSIGSIGIGNQNMLPICRYSVIGSEASIGTKYRLLAPENAVAALSNSIGIGISAEVDIGISAYRQKYGIGPSLGIPNTH